MRLGPLLLIALATPAVAQTWVSLGSPAGPECEIRSVTATPEGPAVTTPCGPYRYSGGAWDRLGTETLSTLGVTGSGVLYGHSEDQAPVRYDPSSDAWVPLSVEGLPTDGVYDGQYDSLSSLVVQTDGTVWVRATVDYPLSGGSGGYYRTLDDGATWTRSDVGGRPFLQHQMADGMLSGIRVSCDFDPPCLAYTVIGRDGDWTYGDVAEEFAQDFSFGAGDVIEWAPSDTAPAYLMSFDGTVLRSVDGSVFVGTGLEAGAVFDLLGFPGRSSVLAATASGLLESVDGGRSWTPLAAPFFDAGGTIRDLALAGDGAVYAVASEVRDGELRLYRTTQPLASEAAPTADTAPVLRVGPNPATAGRATVRFQLAQAGPARLEVYDLMGRLVGVLIDGERPPGQYEVPLPVLAPGVHLVRLVAGGQAETARVHIVR